MDTIVDTNTEIKHTEIEQIEKVEKVDKDIETEKFVKLINSENLQDIKQCYLE